jgi:hypothetical protein
MYKMNSRNISQLLVLFFLASCAFVHKHQIQDVDSRILKGKRFEFVLSQTGVEVTEGVRLVGILSGNKNTNKSAQSIANIIALFQMGPRTGRPVYSLDFTNKLTQKLLKVCPGKELSGLTFLREMNTYPVVSGEIIKVAGYCI